MGPRSASCAHFSRQSGWRHHLLFNSRLVADWNIAAKVAQWQDHVNYWLGLGHRQIVRVEGERLTPIVGHLTTLVRQIGRYSCVVGCEHGWKRGNSIAARRDWRQSEKKKCHD